MESRNVPVQSSHLHYLLLLIGYLLLNLHSLKQVMVTLALLLRLHVCFFLGWLNSETYLHTSRLFFQDRNIFRARLRRHRWDLLIPSSTKQERAVRISIMEYTSNLRMRSLAHAGTRVLVMRMRELFAPKNYIMPSNSVITSCHLHAAQRYTLYSARYYRGSFHYASCLN